MFGYSVPIGGAVVSIFRAKKWYKDNWPLTFYCILAHELGHFFGIGRHCNNRDCIMEQVNVPGGPDLLEKALHLYRLGKIPNGVPFCEHVKEALGRKLRDLYSKSI